MAVENVHSLTSTLPLHHSPHSPIVTFLPIHRQPPLANMRSISSLEVGLFDWTIRARCTHKNPLRPYRNANGPGQITSFDLTDDSGSIRVTAFGKAAVSLDDLITEGATYLLDSTHAWIRRANPRYRTVNDFELNIDAPACIRQVPANSSQKYSDGDDDDDTDGSDWHVAPSSSSAHAAAVTASSSHSPGSRKLGPSFVSVSDVHTFPAGTRCDVRGVISVVENLENGVLGQSRRITISDSATSDSVKVKLFYQHATKLEDGDLTRSPRIELQNAEVRRGLEDRVTLMVDSRAHSDVEFPPTPSRPLLSPAQQVQEITRGVETLHPTKEHSNGKGSVTAPSPGPSRYTVFISHAGPDKETVAIPLYERLKSQRIHSFIDREGLRTGDTVSKSLLNAMNTAMVGVFILSPEFVARKWPFKELRCFMDRRKEADVQGTNPPRIIPVFHRWSVADCKNPAFFKIPGLNGVDVFQKHGFFDKRRQEEASTATVGQYLRELTDLTGIEKKKRNIWSRISSSIDTCLIDNIADAVVENHGTIVLLGSE